MSSLQKECVNLFYSQVGRDKQSLLELNKDTSIYIKAEGQVPLNKPLSTIYQTTWSASWEICMQVRKQQLELDMEQQTGSK